MFFCGAGVFEVVVDEAGVLPRLPNSAAPLVAGVLPNNPGPLLAGLFAVCVPNASPLVPLPLAFCCPPNVPPPPPEAVLPAAPNMFCGVCAVVAAGVVEPKRVPPVGWEVGKLKPPPPLLSAPPNRPGVAVGLPNAEDAEEDVGVLPNRLDVGVLLVVPKIGPVPEADEVAPKRPLLPVDGALPNKALGCDALDDGVALPNRVEGLFSALEVAVPPKEPKDEAAGAPLLAGAELATEPKLQPEVGFMLPRCLDS